MIINPWKTMWTQPRMTIRYLMQTKQKKDYGILAAIYGFSVFAPLLGMLVVQFSPSGWIFFIAFLLFAPLYGYLAFAIEAFLLKFIGKFLNGVATYHQIKLVV
nr:hypothetical protein [Chlamydiales bacterium]